jgi:hypothetical protein
VTHFAIPYAESFIVKKSAMPLMVNSMILWEGMPYYFCFHGIFPDVTTIEKASMIVKCFGQQLHLAYDLGLESLLIVTSSGSGFVALLLGDSGFHSRSTLLEYSYYAFFDLFFRDR